ncbi:MAG: hypothetical protein EXR98_14690 [Gemmataceae bacterium]|nr:hypothetical protein [Gemmataceae bacterium]
MSPHECKSLNLDNAAEYDETRNSIWLEAKKFRGKAATLRERPDGERLLLHGALFYSLACEDRNLPDQERILKAVEYFVLARDPEFDPADPPRRTPKIDGSYLTSAYSAQGQDRRPTFHFAFNNEGANLFRTLTRKNVPTEEKDPDGFKVKRHLGIILDGMLMSAPTINSEIGGQGQISGNFTQKEVDHLVNILRAGRLPASLKTPPVSEQVVPAKPDK